MLYIYTHKANTTKTCIREEFLGCIPIVDRTVEGLAKIILTTSSEFGLNMEKLVGQGYDGCSTMAGKAGGVQALSKKTSKSHICSSTKFSG